MTDDYVHFKSSSLKYTRGRMQPLAYSYYWCISRHTTSNSHKR